MLNNTWYDRENRERHATLDKGIKSSFFTAGKLDKDVETLYEAVGRSFGKGTVTAALNQPSGRGSQGRPRTA